MDDFEFEIKGLTVTITKYKGIPKDVVIPAKIQGKPVTAIRGEAFKVNSGCEKWHSISLAKVGADVSRIPWPAAENTLTSVVIPDSVTTIGERAFGNNQLTSVNIPGSVTTIEGWTFSGNRLKSIVIPKNVTTIGPEAFSLNQLVNVKIPAGVTEIDGCAFWINLLENIDIPDSVTSIGNGAFLENPLVSIRIGSGVNLGERENSFPNNFDDYYKSIGKKAGIYTFDGSNWKAQGKRKGVGHFFRAIFASSR